MCNYLTFDLHTLYLLTFSFVVFVSTVCAYALCSTFSYECEMEYNYLVMKISGIYCLIFGFVRLLIYIYDYTPVYDEELIHNIRLSDYV